MTKHLGRLLLNNSSFWLCDVQERFRPLIHNFPSVLWVASTMTKASKILNIPMVVTEQYPKALGHTCSEVGLTNQSIFEKKKFSMLDEGVTKYIEQDQILKARKQAVLFGIEAHVCILQTAFDLLERDYEVHVVADGISSQRKFDRDVAIERLKQSGAYLTTSESILFQLIGSADHELFKQVSALVNAKAERPDPSTF
jgi:hypothetical protein